MATLQTIAQSFPWRPWLAAPVALVLSLLAPRPVTSGPLFFALALAWGAYLVASLAGWGLLLARRVLPERIGWAGNAALGMAAAVLAGGLLNLCGVISRPLLLVLLAAGFGVLASDLWPRRQTLVERTRAYVGELRVDRWRTGLLVLLGLLTFLQLTGAPLAGVNNVSTYRDFDVHDDYQAYLVFPQKMLQLGSLGAEPFDARRMICLGGQPFLQTLVLAALPLRALHLLDAGVALLICLGLLAGLLRALEVAPRLRALVLVFAVVLPHLEARGNTTAVLTAVALLLAWFRLAAAGTLERGQAVPNAVVVALLASALCALKPTMIPVAALFFAFSYSARLVRATPRAQVLLEAGLGAVLVFVMLAPWMIALYQSSGTLLYPILGKGYFGSVYTGDFAAVTGDFSIPTGEMLEHIRRNLLRVLPLVTLLLGVRARSPRAPALALALTAVVATVVLVVVNDPYLDRSIYRYAFPLVAGSLLALIASALAKGAPASEQPPALVAAVLVALLGIFATPATLWTTTVAEPWRTTRAALTSRPLEDAGQRDEMRALQNAVPAGAALLARVPYPFYLDFERNPIHIDSLPGMASPPPGLPTFRGGEAVAGYLAEHGIRYVAYGARTDQLRLLNLTEADIANRYPRSRVRHVMLAYHRDLENNVLELARSRQHLVDNEQSFVLDLATRATAASVDAPRIRPEHLADKDNVLADNNWTTGNAVLRGLELTVPVGHRHLAVAIGQAHPFRTDVARLAVRVWADDTPLVFERADGAVLLFALPADVPSVHTLRVVSSTFVPRELGLGQDSRTLGIPIAWISTR